MAEQHKKLLDEKQMQELERMGKIGLPHEHIAAIFDMSRTTFDQLLKKDDAVRLALSKGKANGTGKLLTTAFDMATRGDCPAMTIFYLKTRHGWKEPKDEVVVINKDASLSLDDKVEILSKDPVFMAKMVEKIKKAEANE